MLRTLLYIQLPAIIITVVLIAAPYAWAEDSWSANFTANNAVVNEYGGLGTSTGFTLIESGGEVQAGAATSSHFRMHSGSLYYDSSSYVTKNWRWYDDEGSETPTNALAAENTAPTNISQNTIKLRITVRETEGLSAERTKFRLQFSTDSNFSSGGTMVVESANCGAYSEWCYENAAGDDNATNTSKVLSDSDDCSGSVGRGCGTHNESGMSTSMFTHTATSSTEYEFTISEHGTAVSTVYFFRLFNTLSSTTVPVDTSESYPSLVTGGATLTFSINGLESGTSTEGVTTSIDTSAVAVPFGTLSLNASRYAAQRLEVSTNAGQGYAIYTFQRQGLLSEGGDEINPVLGTNPAPSGWSTGCDTSAAGCYGYHAGDDVLAGASNRFAGNDTYAQFSSSPSEIAYSATPATEEKTDMVYRVHVRNLQDAGSYSGTIVYIVTPVF